MGLSRTPSESCWMRVERWDLSAAARPRWLMLLPWAAGFVTYQLINPGYVSWWASA
jgi:hypothetical protein